jgi:hypothetical protein
VKSTYLKILLIWVGACRLGFLMSRQSFLARNHALLEINIITVKGFAPTFPSSNIYRLRTLQRTDANTKKDFYVIWKTIDCRFISYCVLSHFNPTLTSSSFTFLCPVLSSSTSLILTVTFSNNSTVTSLLPVVFSV